MVLKEMIAKLTQELEESHARCEQVVVAARKEKEDFAAADGACDAPALVVAGAHGVVPSFHGVVVGATVAVDPSNP